MKIVPKRHEIAQRIANQYGPAPGRPPSNCYPAPRGTSFPYHGIQTAARWSPLPCPPHYVVRNFGGDLYCCPEGVARHIGSTPPAPGRQRCEYLRIPGNTCWQPPQGTYKLIPFGNTCPDGFVRTDEVVMKWNVREYDFECITKVWQEDSTCPPTHIHRHVRSSVPESALIGKEVKCCNYPYAWTEVSYFEVCIPSPSISRSPDRHGRKPGPGKPKRKPSLSSRTFRIIP